jgi:hypothetical protein
MNEADALIDLIRKIEEALAIVAHRTENLGITLEKAELELKVASRKSAKAGGKIDFVVSIDASVEKEWSKAHTVTLSLIPKAKVVLGKDESSLLAETIIIMANAMRRAVTGNFNASEATVSIDIEETKDGSIQVVGGGGGNWANSHLVKLTFRPN